MGAIASICADVGHGMSCNEGAKVGIHYLERSYHRLREAVMHCMLLCSTYGRGTQRACLKATTAAEQIYISATQIHTMSKETVHSL